MKALGRRTRRRVALASAIVLDLALGGARPAGATPTLDQQQLVYDGGTSARTLPGYRVWQSFTAGLGGTLCGIDMGFFNDMAGQGELRILAGEGCDGTVLQTLTVPVVGITQPGVTWNAWTVEVAVTAGSTYTFCLTPDAATLPDPYGVAIGASNPYGGGLMGLDDPSGSYPTGFDVVFRTWVCQEELGVYRDTRPDDLVAPAHRIGVAVAAYYDDLAPPPAPIFYYAVDDGGGDPDLILMAKRPGGDLRITWN